MSIYPERLNYYVDGGAVTKPQFSAVATLLSLVNEGVVPPIVNDLVWLSFALALHASEGGHTCIDLNEIDRWYPENAEPGALNWPPKMNGFKLCLSRLIWWQLHQPRPITHVGRLF